MFQSALGASMTEKERQTSLEVPSLALRAVSFPIWTDLRWPQMGVAPFFGSECPFFGACKGTPRGKNRNTLVPFEEETKTTLVPFEEQPGAPNLGAPKKQQSRGTPKLGAMWAMAFGAKRWGLQIFGERKTTKIRPRSQARGLLPRRRPSLRCPRPVGADAAAANAVVQASAPGEGLAKKGVGLKKKWGPQADSAPNFHFQDHFTKGSLNKQLPSFDAMEWFEDASRSCLSLGSLKPLALST